MKGILAGLFVMGAGIAVPSLMGGVLTVESNVGSGSQFTLWLPLADSGQRAVAHSGEV